MGNTMTYNGYVARIEYDDSADQFHGRVENIRDVVDFYGSTPAVLRDEFARSVEDYIEFCREEGQEPEKPTSGKFQVRITPEDHRRLIKATQVSGARSLNEFVADAIREATGKYVDGDGNNVE
jgi:predicted HicB family RNase H-like nuclease